MRAKQPQLEAVEVV
uniref:Uncharacterized protein n=1 Tax=Anguilla anguilla TaxID=7936 RepID=A0A0E9TFY5_ANGAN